MRCYDAESCFNEIIAYFNSEVSGYPFITNIDDATILQDICSKMQADSNKRLLGYQTTVMGTIFLMKVNCSLMSLLLTMELSSDYRHIICFVENRR